jgi:hypothetical protein
VGVNSEGTALQPIRREELQALLSYGGDGPHASLYMPAIKAGPETRQNAIRFRNLLRALETQLHDGGLPPGEVTAFLAKAAALQDDFEFWQHADSGFALFLSQGLFEYHHLPEPVAERVVVGRRFYLRPLLAQLTEDQRFFVLALSQNAVRLLAAGPHSVRALDLGNTPLSLADALGHQLTDKQLQLHSVGPEGAPAQFHGQGIGKDDVKPELRKFLAMVDDGVRDRIGGDGRPLVLAGVTRLVALYREASGYRPILAEGVHGNHERVSDEALRDQAWPIVEPYLAQAFRSAAERFQSADGTGVASKQVEDVVPAACDGRVDTLFVARDDECWGRYDASTRRVERHPEAGADSVDLLELATAQSFLQGAKVFARDAAAVPGGGPVAAIFRY